MPTSRRLTAAALLALGLASPLRAHAPADLDPAKTMRAVRVGARTPHIDGRLDDEVWQRAPTFTGLTQEIPDDGSPATEKTVLQFAYDEHALYVAMTLYSSDPELVADNLTRRDQTYDADRFRIEIDTHHDHQTAYMFELSAAGVQRDAHITHNGDGFDGNWDAVWDGAVARHEGYLGAEWRIPYAALRFSAEDHYVWGINVVRSMPLKHEMVYWVRIPRNERGWVSRFGHLTGIEGVSPARALEVLPYAVGRSIAYPGSGQDADLSARAGADIRYGISHGTSLNATLNPDFGQVEADPAELNLTVFETFQSERRPFFVEGAQTFDTPIDLFYSRRIGRQPGYLAIPEGSTELSRPDATTVLGALKLTGKTRGGTTFGLMQALTAEEHARVASIDVPQRALIEPRSNYLAGRVIQDVLRNSHVGVLGTALHRDGGDHAYTGGLDWKLNTDDNDYEWTGQVAVSRAGGDDGWGADVVAGKRTGRWRAEAALESYSPGFDLNDMGYLRRADWTRAHVELELRNEDPWRAFRSNSLWLERWRAWNGDDVVLEDAVEAGAWNQLLTYQSFGAGVTHRYRARDDRQTRGGPLVVTPAENSWWISVENDWRQPYSAWVDFSWGSDSASGTRRRLSAGIRLKPAPWVEVSLRPSFAWNHDDAQWYDNVDSDGDGLDDRFVFGELDTRTLDLTSRADLIFTPHLSLETYVQPFVSVGDYGLFKALAAPGSYAFDPYVPADASADFRRRSLRSNVVLRWEYRPGSTAFLVWSQNRSQRTDDAGLRPLHNLGHSFTDGGTNVFFAKVSYWSNP